MQLIVAIYDFFLRPLLTILVWVIILNAILSWLIAFRVVNPHNQFVSMIANFTMRVTDPLLRPLRRVIPYIGGIDITPIILILAIFFVRDWVLPQLLLLGLRATGAT